MNISEPFTPYNHHQQFHCQYGANALLPDIDWQKLFIHNQLSTTHLRALNTLYQCAVPLALQVFDELKFDVFTPHAYKPQGLGLFEKLAEQEDRLIQALEIEIADLDQNTRHQIWSMLLRGGAVLVFKAWLGQVKNNETYLDTTQFDELSDLLFIKTSPLPLAHRLGVNPQAEYDHIFLFYDHEIYLDRFNCLETAALFVDLGVYDAAFLALRDAQVAHYLKQLGYVTDDQMDELCCALNPLYCTDLTPQQDCIA
ncbi:MULTISPECIES: hypothetical protein [unclassified Acinetobacter]|uniref:hypothetical protein n=1 Tax=unclassified Acinetobacter TaxID=196816 RepID=UPI002935010D|nr:MULTISPECIES: hypothetical protein [unclassified Acinetobacter]WOE30985.1 hypothetical protein QSG84_11605 [Acinetobacter sp. SAAs470]WOE39181.1 hypothetical protein QSG86_05270 [Acinetobacter sp. SAAs474]